MNKKQLKSTRGPFSSLFKATSCGWYFSDYASESAMVRKITISMLNNSFKISFRAKNSIERYRKSYPRNQKMYPYFTFDLYFKVKLRSRFLFYTENVCNLIYVLIIKLIFCINDNSTHLIKFMFNIYLWPSYQCHI
jgi:hypothetical protein